MAARRTSGHMNLQAFAPNGLPMAAEPRRRRPASIPEGRGGPSCCPALQAETSRPFCRTCSSSRISLGMLGAKRRRGLRCAAACVKWGEGETSVARDQRAPSRTVGGGTRASFRSFSVPRSPKGRRWRRRAIDNRVHRGLEARCEPCAPSGFASRCGTRIVAAGHGAGVRSCSCWRRRRGEPQKDAP